RQGRTRAQTRDRARSLRDRLRREELEVSPNSLRRPMQPVAQKDQGARSGCRPDVGCGPQRQARPVTSTGREEVSTMSHPPNNRTARAARWSAAHWKTATFGWLGFVLVAFALGSAVGTNQVDQNKPGPGESGRMQKILDEGFKQPVGENVLIQTRSASAGDP